MVTLGALLCGATAAQAKTLRVDDDGVQDKEANYRSIQDAVDAAQPQDVIKVAPGIYTVDPKNHNAVVWLNKPGLTLLGAQHGNHNVKRMTSTPDPTQESIIVPPPNTLNAVLIQHDKTTVDGFFVMDANTHAVTVLTLSRVLSGVRIQNNVIRLRSDLSKQGIFGIHLQGLSHSSISNNIIFEVLGLNNSPSNTVGINSHEVLSDVSIIDNKMYNVGTPLLIVTP
jgi:hypothetical protein